MHTRLENCLVFSYVPWISIDVHVLTANLIKWIELEVFELHGLLWKCFSLSEILGFVLLVDRSTDSEELLIIKTRQSLLEALTEHVRTSLSQLPLSLKFIDPLQLRKFPTPLCVATFCWLHPSHFGTN